VFLKRGRTRRFAPTLVFGRGNPCGYPYFGRSESKGVSFLNFNPKICSHIKDKIYLVNLKKLIILVYIFSEKEIAVNSDKPPPTIIKSKENDRISDLCIDKSAFNVGIICAYESVLQICKAFACKAELQNINEIKGEAHHRKFLESIRDELKSDNKRKLSVIMRFFESANELLKYRNKIIYSDDIYEKDDLKLVNTMKKDILKFIKEHL